MDCVVGTECAKKNGDFSYRGGYKVNMSHVLVVVVAVFGESFVGENVGFCDICALSFARRAWGKALAFALCWIVFRSCCLYGGVRGNWFILLGRNRSAARLCSMGRLELW